MSENIPISRRGLIQASGIGVAGALLTGPASGAGALPRMRTIRPLTKSLTDTRLVRQCRMPPGRSSVSS